MNRMVNIIGILLLLTFSIGVSGQNPYIERFVPPSPTASSLGQYGEVPVSLYTGVANVQVPLYTLQERGLSVPINLSYHASGIKVDQMPSWWGWGGHSTLVAQSPEPLWDFLMRMQMDTRLMQIVLLII
ncbi:hypothetical protein [uncultured Roseivirga sp.]|uniref:hypothetical protein n=1 Tax=uncultured Roseivirga sp. TaxID=543088 RepID=UPI0030D8F3F2